MFLIFRLSAPEVIDTGVGHKITYPPGHLKFVQVDASPGSEADLVQLLLTDQPDLGDYIGFTDVLPSSRGNRNGWRCPNVPPGPATGKRLDVSE